MRFWLCVSVLAAFTLGIAPVRGIGASPNCAFLRFAQDVRHRQNETTLAGLRPGRDKLRAAIEKIGPSYRKVVPGAEDVVAWVDKTKHRLVRVELDKDGVIQSITVSTIDPLIEEAGDPKKEPETPLPTPKLATGHGIRVANSACSDVEATYGRANSDGPSTQHGKELRLLYYSFDWAGPKVPQVMEASCEPTTGTVVQITLSFPSL